MILNGLYLDVEVHLIILIHFQNIYKKMVYLQSFINYLIYKIQFVPIIFKSTIIRRFFNRYYLTSAKSQDNIYN